MDAAGGFEQLAESGTEGTIVDCAADLQQQISTLSRPAHLGASKYLLDGRHSPDISVLRWEMLQAGLKPMQEKLSTLTRLVTADDRHAPDQAFTLAGEAFEAAVGKRIRVRTVRDVKRAIRLLNGVKKGLAYV